MALVIVGMDEAGYGPLLGPMCVAAAALRVESWREGDTAPDLWKFLGKGACRSLKHAGSRVVIADSKQLKLPNSGSARHPLTYLERGVMAFLASIAGWAAPAQDAQLCERLGCAWPEHPCYGGDAVELPLAWSAGEVGIAANVLRAACAEGGVTPLWLGCVAIPEGTFNSIVRDTGSKASVTLSAIRELLARLATLELREGDHVRIVCDRLGGRTDYLEVVGELLAEWTPKDVRELDQTPERSRYSAQTSRGPVGVTFQVEAESHHLPVAMASMTAKYIRELAMLRFNRHWTGLRPDLRPTAGYYQDARRWLSDAGGVITAVDRRELIRIA